MAGGWRAPDCWLLAACDGSLHRTQTCRLQLVTATDVFAKQLMCMRLMTPERAKAIIAKYPTITRYGQERGLKSDCHCAPHSHGHSLQFAARV